MTSPEQQLHKAWLGSGLTLRRLGELACLDLSIVSLSRKLRGLQTLSTDECAALARVLGVQVLIGNKQRKAAA